MTGKATNGKGNGNGKVWGVVIAECTIIAAISLAIYVVLSERIYVNRDATVALEVRLKAEIRELDDNIIDTATATNIRVDEQFAALDDTVLFRLKRVEESVDKLREYMQSLEIRTVAREPDLSNERK